MFDVFLGVFLGVFCALIIFVLIIFVLTHTPATGRDDTDGERRSGLVIYTDNKTKIQYVGTPLGGLTVRVDESGKPMKGGE